MKLPILNLEKYDNVDQEQKIAEEFEELMNYTNTKENDIEEAIDLIQATFGFLQKIATQEELEEAFEKHNEKLKAREWETEGHIELTFHY